ncbi:hypothetical protein FIT80_00650 [Candidatus Methylopumilus universalis]|uniref:hypothetical protein n=1 Tax=Candidatus Methylopumilus universalis TaxID=2588536 RepID=UPI00111DCE12|nr:hypothetical protein [Candidatus Methylopumilus universalis]QDC90059.1 hypothetical protein FIT80_00650 [Candidatus Methylopumilus universalis]
MKKIFVLILLIFSIFDVQAGELYFGSTKYCLLYKNSTTCTLSEQGNKLLDLQGEVLAYMKGLNASKSADDLEYEILNTESDLISAHNDLITAYKNYLELQQLVTEKKQISIAQEIIDTEHNAAIRQIELFVQKCQSDLDFSKLQSSRGYIQKHLSLLRQTQNILKVKK